MKTFKKYIRIYAMLVRYSVIIELTYATNFTISILVELFYQASFFAFFAVIMSKTQLLGGWGVNEMLVFLGIDTFVSELLTGMVIVWNSRELPYKIWSGELDGILLKPIHPLFTLTLGRPHFPSFISALIGFMLIGIGIYRMGYIPELTWFIGSILFFLFGFVIVYSIIVLFSLLSFFFQDTWTLPRIGERIVYSFTSRPHAIFSGWLKAVFFFILPTVYVSSFSASTLISGLDPTYLSLSLLLAGIFIILTKFMWGKAIRRYSSASS